MYFFKKHLFLLSPLVMCCVGVWASQASSEAAGGQQIWSCRPLWAAWHGIELGTSAEECLLVLKCWAFSPALFIYLLVVVCCVCSFVLCQVSTQASTQVRDTVQDSVLCFSRVDPGDQTQAIVLVASTSTCWAISPVSGQAIFIDRWNMYV